MSAAASAVAPETARPFGRFTLQRMLGEGAHATVWLGFDQRLEREVAVKRMRSDAAADPVAVGEWLREARSVSRLTHPNIVPVFEADVLDDQPYLVFEYVPGPTLAQLLKARGALPAHEAAGLALGILDALHEAHGAGVVHRDLKPSNVLVGPGGRARVMDFGIAARLHDPGGADLIVGTPGYMSPEATRGAVPTAPMDLFSVGLMLAEMLSGKRLIHERDPYRAMQRVADEDLALPDGLAADVNDALRAVLRRALERDPAVRWQSAAAFREALQTWQTPDPGVASTTAASGGGTLDFLLRRMRHKSDFPAMSDAVTRIQRLTASDSQNLNALADAILKDVALTNKLLRLVNSARYGQAPGGIATVSRAIALVGFAGVRNLATSLVMLEHLHDKAHAAQLREEFLRALLAGMLASELGAGAGDGEDAFVAAMYHHLGRLLAEFYLPEEARQVRGIVAGQSGAASTVEANASAQVLGLTFEALGVGVAKTWGLPASIQACMRRPAGEPPARPPATAAERLRWLAIAANHVADVLLRTEPEQARSRVADLARRYAGALDLKAERIVVATAAAQRQLGEMVEATSMPLAAEAPARRLFTVAADRDEPTTLGGAATLSPTSLGAAVPYDAGSATRVTTPSASPVGTAGAVERLAAGSHAITDAMAADVRLNELLRMILETMRHGLGFRRVVFCLRDLRTETLTGRLGLGEGADVLATGFEVALRGSADLFSTACLKGTDVLIADAAAPAVLPRLPAWYRRKGPAGAFLLLPVQRGGASMGLIYADRDTLALTEQEWSLLRTLRNQAVLAFRQGG
jgi:serine/threonine protein kinase